VERLARANAAQVINLKLTKSGLSESLRMIHAAHRHNLQLMIGGMVESTLCMTTSACIAAGIGGFSFFDLDTPFFMGETGLVGGFRVEGASLIVDGLGVGHGVTESSAGAKGVAWPAR
jgi:L-alanine-DL-glutamate epimerase-like enolase superfamily enzyme